ncbi:hypothetical protein ACWV26_17750 [Rummeliibacillus sp. JY-2-4R]
MVKLYERANEGEQIKKHIAVKCDYDRIKQLKRHYTHAGMTDFEELAQQVEIEIEKALASNAEADHINKGQLEIFGAMLDSVALNLEREAEMLEIQERSAEEWRQLEYEYAKVKPGGYSMFTLEHIKQPHIFAKYQECAHRFCITGFRPANGKQKYCCPECAEAEKNARKEFKRTSKLYVNGTYLPVYAYKTRTQQHMDELYKEHERVFGIGVQERMTKTSRASRERAIRKQQIDREVCKAGASEVITYKLSEMTDAEIKEKFGDSFLNEIRKKA